MSAPGQSVEPDEPPARRYATREEVEVQFNALTPRERTVLREWARSIAQKSHNKFGDGWDLMSTVMVKMLSEPPKRKWYPKDVEFFPFLRHAIRSTGNGWKKKAKREEPLPPVEVEGTPNNEQAVTNEIRAYLDGQSHEHLHALDIFDLLGEGYNHTETQERVGIAPHEYRATLKWMRETLRAKGYWP